ncbi:unnamed protein product [Cyclocybe aegerita]|uniref:Uncharacterized protein n=1 Tax=Cyclocybe aegerita TaxID=1973307 RepID=A0A8S0VUC1_CYCAE|nr:unnamed protein product [Cyclocybe aegerita]
MAQALSRRVVVDDTSPDISYSGPWFQDQGSQNTIGFAGFAYKSTLHGTKSNASLSLPFSGSQVQVLGTNRMLNDSGIIDPTWECFIDNISIGSTPPSPVSANRWLFCEQLSLLDGPHVLTLNATIRINQTFWFDTIEYVPSPGVSLENKAIGIDSLDPQVLRSFDSRWSNIGDFANMTRQDNALFSFDFYGESLGWYGFIPTELPHVAAPASFSVDGEEPHNFMIRAIPADSQSVYNQLFFQTDTYPNGQHNLRVLFHGNSTTTPLTLDYLIIQNGTTTASSSPSPTVSSTFPVSNGAPSNVGAIVGGVVGGFAVVVLLVLLYIYRRRKRRGEQRNEQEISQTVQPFLFPAPQPTLSTSSASPSSCTQDPKCQCGGVHYTGGLHPPLFVSDTSTSSRKPPEPSEASSSQRPSTPSRSSRRDGNRPDPRPRIEVPPRYTPL